MTRVTFTATLLCLLFCATLSAAPAAASNPGDGFAAGNASYAAGNFAEAAHAYERQVSTGRVSANLFYNLADAYYRQGDRDGRSSTTGGP